MLYMYTPGKYQVPGSYAIRLYEVHRDWHGRKQPHTYGDVRCQTPAIDAR